MDNLLTKRTKGNDCDFVALNRDNIGFTGIALIDKISIATKILPDTLIFPKSSIAYVHFKNLPHQPNDYIQLTSGGSVEGEIRDLEQVKFVIAESGQEIDIPRSALLVLMFRCSIDAAAKAFAIDPANVRA